MCSCRALGILANEVPLLNGVQAFIVRRTQHRRQCLAKLAGVRLSVVRVEGVSIFPHGEDREMVGARRRLLKNVVAQIPVVFPAFVSQSFQ